MAKEKAVAPLQIKIIGWYGIVLACTYLIWGVVSIILSILDRTYKDIDQNFLILIYGLIVLTFSTGFKNVQKWGWMGYLVVLAFMVVWTVFRYTDFYGILWGVLSLIALVAILSPPVRKHFISN